MHPHHALREIAKVGTGLVLADLVSVIWLSAAGLFPLSILGVEWTGAMVPEILVFDAGILLLLIHFGWNMRLPVSSPSERTLLYLAGTLFLVVAIAHFLRITFGWSLILGGFAVPQWLSWIGFAVTLYLSYSSFHFARMRRR
ncbi:MAG TPA: hypothetical protein VMT80_00895 [Candidatus Paceibacterota bacterium]|nr:hypothetical protein [Candidatus Paceibacterota bacterium]